MSLAVRASDGAIFMHGVATDRWYSVNPTTLVATPLAVLPFDTNFGQGGTFDPNNGTLYHAAFNATAFQGQLYTINPATGAATFVGNMGDLTNPQPNQISDIAIKLLGPPPTPTATATGTPASPTPTPTPTATPSPCGVNTFSNPAAITINDASPATPYPSNITVAGLTGTITKVTVKLNGLSHTFPDDIDVLLVGPGGNLIIMSDVGGSTAVTGITLTLDDAAAANLPDSTILTTGTFKPTNIGAGDPFAAPAPAPSANTTFSSTFNGTTPNGTWSLYVVDDLGGDVGSFAGGWTLNISTTTGVCGTPTPTPSGTPATPTPSPSPSGTPCGVTLLFDQTDNPAGSSTVSQDFGAGNPTFVAQTADDFVVPAGQTWTVQTVVAKGVYFNGPGPAATFNVTFYANTATLPGAPVPLGTYTGLAYVQTGAPPTTFTINLPTSLVLTPGTYWISVQARMDFAPGGEWGWTDRTVISNSGAAWQNPLGGFGTTCAVYTRKTTCIPTAAPDNLFQLIGTNGAGCASPTPSPSGTPATPTPSPTATATATATPAGRLERDRGWHL